MINAFLTSLYNRSTPVSQSPTMSGDILLDSSYSPYPYVDDEEEYGRDFLFDGLSGDYEHLVRALELSYLVGASGYSQHLVAVDPRVTYTQQNVREHVIAAGIPSVGGLLADVGAPQLSVLRSRVTGGEDPPVASTMDALALTACYFGRRAWA